LGATACSTLRSFSRRKTDKAAVPTETRNMDMAAI
jgi:hypothetical protein